MRPCFFLLFLLGCPSGDSDKTVDADDDGVPADTDCDDNDEAVGEAAEWNVDTDHDGYGGLTPITACAAPDDAVDDASDCDDGDSAVHPDALEACDGIDNNCDGAVDEGATTTFFADADGDGFGDAMSPIDACEPPEGAVVNSDDCDDTDGERFPGQAEACNQKDDDCDDEIDEGAPGTQTWYIDADGDGYGDPADSVETCGAPPEGRALNADDCDDANGAVNPAAREVCNTIDDDCDGLTDEDDAADAAIWYIDDDSDGYGTDASTVLSCAQPDGYSAYNDDCDDADAAYHPGAAEADCSDPNDYNCDGSVAYADADADGWAACTECDDGNPDANPAATEVCDGADNDCDGTIDEPDATDAATWYADTDADTFGDASNLQIACNAPLGYVADATDCDDALATVNPAATETCNGMDDDCDGTVDEADAADASSWYADSDGDGYGDPSSFEIACDQPIDYVADATDCDDGRRLSHPGATEYCNSEDDDCNGTVDDAAVDSLTYWQDSDGDTYGNAFVSVTDCSAPAGYVRDDDDCDDTDAAVNPAAAELCNSIDDDCDGSVDDGLAFTTYYTDADGDTYGEGTGTSACAAPSGAVTTDDDCDDADAAINPAAEEVCDAVDNDCDGTVDGVSTDYDFDSGIASAWMVLNSDAHAATSGGNGYLALTNNATSSTGTAWFVERMDATAFEVSFSFYIHSGSGADGLTFAWLSDTSTASIGAGGGYMGVYGLHGYAVEFDTYYNSGWDPSENHVALIDPATLSNYTYSTAIPELEDTGWHDATISMAGGVVEVWLDGTRYINYTLASYTMTDAMMGFTAATGGATNYHDIDDVSFACP